jgi:hypothetical protein
VFWFVIVGFLLLVGPLAILFGADSRIDEVARQQRFRT